MELSNLWKIKKDPFYGELYESYGLDFVRSAGFFYDSMDELSRSIFEQNLLKVLCTPFNFLKKPETNQHCVLVITGSMCPIHTGHLEALKYASLKMESLGYEVLGSYICPDHD